MTSCVDILNHVCQQNQHYPFHNCWFLPSIRTHEGFLDNGSLGRGGRFKSSQDPGIAKKGVGGSDPCQDFFGEFNIVHRGQPKVIMDL